jgi:SAM-dependent methyltransferase
MTVGRFARKILGPAFLPIGQAYRRIFVDMPKIVEVLAENLPCNAHVLDVGGGDGYVTNLLLEKRPDITFTMIDLAGEIGGFISTTNLERVALRPRTDLRDLSGAFDALIMTDVLHHIPRDNRNAFLKHVSEASYRIGCNLILIKDIEPGHFRAFLSLLSDLLITGDSAVSLVRAHDIQIPGFDVEWIAYTDTPNYCIRFRRQSHDDHIL